MAGKRKRRVSFGRITGHFSGIRPPDGSFPAKPGRGRGEAYSVLTEGSTCWLRAITLANCP
jgi:hypothetical protein